jgi:hypothetical protein
MSQAKGNSQLASKFGFDDPDRKNHKHNYTAQYIEKNIDKIAQYLYGSNYFEFTCFPENGKCLCLDKEHPNIKLTDYVIKNVNIKSLDPEKLISKGKGQYKTTIGFMDVSIHIGLTIEIIYEGWESEIREEHITFGQAKELRKHEPGKPYVNCNDKIFSSGYKIDRTEEDMDEKGFFKLKKLVEEKKIKTTYDSECWEALELKYPDIKKLIEKSSIKESYIIAIFKKSFRIFSDVYRDHSGLLKLLKLRIVSKRKKGDINNNSISNIEAQKTTDSNKRKNNDSSIEHKEKYNKTLDFTGIDELTDSDRSHLFFSTSVPPVNFEEKRKQLEIKVEILVLKEKEVSEEISFKKALELYRIGKLVNSFLDNETNFKMRPLKDSDIVTIDVYYPKKVQKIHSEKKTCYWPCEVKIAPVGVEDIQCQINFYREYMDEERGSPFLLFTAFDLTEQDVELLKKINVIWIKLGKDFHDWYDSVKNVKATPYFVL